MSFPNPMPTISFLTEQENSAIAEASRHKRIELLNDLAYQLLQPFNKDNWGLLPRLTSMPQSEILELIKVLADNITPLSPEDQP
ncbi:hypothetical protein [Pseudanabaena minima]|uniref:hypothetical protein n=1 Tax=Pseudanabaena minima TaxID=890415 RepID=UPI003DA7DFE3